LPCRPLCLTLFFLKRGRGGAWFIIRIGLIFVHIAQRICLIVCTAGQSAAVEGTAYTRTKGDAEDVILAPARPFPHLTKECRIHIIFHMHRKIEHFVQMCFERCPFIFRYRRSRIADFAFFPVDDSRRTDADASDTFPPVQFLPDEGFNFSEYTVVFIITCFYLFPYRESMIVIHQCTLDECPPDIYSQITHHFT